MTRLEWDGVGGRFYETGLDRGVLYLPSSPGVYDNGVAWNGLVSVNEDLGSDTTTPLYFDGVKYLDTYSFGDAKFNLSAYTYPDEFLTFEGMGELGNGAYLDDQRPEVFALSFRTRIGSDVRSNQYKIHILYNLSAKVGGITHDTIQESIEPLAFEWELNGKPEHAPGYRPTAYVIFDTRYLSPEVLEILEGILYGRDRGSRQTRRIDGLYPMSPDTDILDGGTVADPGTGTVDGNPSLVAESNPHLPSLPDLIEAVTNLRPQLIEPHPSGVADLVDGTGDLSPTARFGIYWALPTTRLTPSSVEGLYTLAAREEA